MSVEGFKPNVFNTITNPKLRAWFEKYNGEQQFENGEPEFDMVRQEIADHFNVPYTTEGDDEDKDEDKKENHLFIVDNEMVEKQRHYRAFCVITRGEGENRDGWYIDGRLPHAVMLRRLYNHYNVPDDDENEISLGFLDDEGFPDIEDIQKKAQEQGRPIQWFIRDVVSPERTSPDKEKNLPKEKPRV